MNKALITYFLFVIYGSLVPLDYKPIPLEQAVRQFQNIAYLELGIESRADWIANILLYIPLSFVGLAAFKKSLKIGFTSQLLFAGLVMVICLATAVGVEFVQQFFPPRTVSLNDLLAETLGAFIGIGCWFAFGERLLGQVSQISQGNWLSVRAAIWFFIPAYLFLSLFPFDFVTSLNELEGKLAGGRDSWFMAWADCRDEGWFRCVVKWGVEILVLLPLGALFAALPSRSHGKELALLVGVLLGIGIESIQIFIYSASAQGFSVITRVLGMFWGVKAFVGLNSGNWRHYRSWLGWVALSLSIPYMLSVAAINGWLQGDWLSLSQAQQKLTETHFLPFYYFYYTTETVALVSLLSNIGCYLPVGLLFWLAGLRKPHTVAMSSVSVGLVAAMFAVVMETGKLFLQAKHVDPTDVILAYLAGAGGYAVLLHIQRIVALPATVGVIQQNVEADGVRDKFDSGMDSALVLRKWALLPVMGLLGVVGYQVWHYPVLPWLLALVALAYGYALFRNRKLALFVLPAALPTLDFAPWTGRFFFDEFDVLVLVSVLVVWSFKLRQFQYSEPRSARTPDKVVLVVFGFAILISTLIGLKSLPEIDANAFSNYYSAYNALRLGKGFLWAGLLSGYVIQGLRDNTGRRYFINGLLSGLAGVVLFTIIERWVFPGLFDFSTDYRVNALFSSMHNGGGHMESYLALAMPFLALWILNAQKSLPLTIAGCVLFFLGLYALLMTFSRGGAVGLAVAYLVLLLGMLVHFNSRHSTQATWRLGATSLLLLIVVAGFALPVFQGEMMRNRLNLAGQDSQSRHHHWATAIEMMDGGMAQAFGMGLGSFPRIFFFLNQEDAHPATYRLAEEAGNAYLVLQGGDALFLGQYIAARPRQRLKLELDIRGLQQNASLSIPICEKSLQYSFRCVSAAFQTKSDRWRHFEQTLDSGDVGAFSDDVAGGWLQRPVQLALYVNSAVGSIVEVDNLKLLDQAGENLIQNGDFSAGIDHWYLSTEKHNPWHLFNIWVHVLFEMGWWGLCAFILLVVIVYCRLLKALKHELVASVLLASFSGFLVIGYVDSPFDTPRLSFLFMLLVFFALFANSKPNQIFKNQK